MAISKRLVNLPAAVVLAGLGVASLGLGASACFNSDEVPQEETDDDDDVPPITDFPDWEKTPRDIGDDSTDGDVSCEDAIECVQGCAGELSQQEQNEPDLSCFLECEEGLTEEEALLLLRLLDCVSTQCAEQGACAVEDEPGTDTEGSPDTECLDCIVGMALDPQPPGCLEEAYECD